MNGLYDWEISGLAELSDLRTLKRNIKTAASRSINRTADRARTATANEIRQQINFPASYLSPAGGRLAVSKRASSENLEARVRAQFRATSLARFITRVGKAGVTVEVKKGVSVELPRAFLIHLKGGVDSKGNKGLAVRLKPGQELRNRKFAKKIANGLYVLYGPSVYQAAKTVFEDVSEESAEFLEREYLRQVSL